MIRNGMCPIHPGEILREEFLVPLAMTPHALSQAIRVPATRINDIVNGKRGVTADTALRLARYFGNLARVLAQFAGSTRPACRRARGCGPH